jgi:hypothetical protein
MVESELKPDGRFPMLLDKCSRLLLAGGGYGSVVGKFI